MIVCIYLNLHFFPLSKSDRDKMQVTLGRSGCETECFGWFGCRRGLWVCSWNLIASRLGSHSLTQEQCFPHIRVNKLTLTEPAFWKCTQTGCNLSPCESKSSLGILNIYSFVKLFDVLGGQWHVFGHLSCSAVLNKVTWPDSTKNRTGPTSDPFPRSFTKWKHVSLSLCCSIDDLLWILLEAVFLFSDEFCILHFKLRFLLSQLLKSGTFFSLYLQGKGKRVSVKKVQSFWLKCTFWPTLPFAQHWSLAPLFLLLWFS